MALTFLKESYRDKEIKEYLIKIGYLVLIISLGFTGRYICVGCQNFFQIFQDAALDMNRVALTIYSATFSFCLVSHISLTKKLKTYSLGLHQIDVRSLIIWNRIFQFGLIVSIIILAFSSVCVNIDYFSKKYLIIIGFYLFSSIFLNILSYSTIRLYINN